MRKIFSNHFANDEARREELWANCLFVFDTNVYTGIYKRSDDARDAFYNVAENLGQRLWAPYQVIYEYLDNRAKISHDQSCIYEEAISGVESIVTSLEIQTKHPFLSVGLHSEFIAIADRVKEELVGKKEFYRSRIHNDDIRSRLLDILDGKVGEKYSKAELGGIIKEGEVRYANMDAPGFKDSGKHKGSNVFDHVCKRYGDLIMWKQILDKAKAESKPVILVTEEQKDDWWEKAGGMTIGPLPELIEEFSTVTGQDFYLYSYHHFLELANAYLKQATSEDVINEVKVSSLDSVSMEEFGDVAESIGNATEYSGDFPLSMVTDWANLDDEDVRHSRKGYERKYLEFKVREVESQMNRVVVKIHNLDSAIEGNLKKGLPNNLKMAEGLKRHKLNSKIELSELKKKLHKVEFMLAGLYD